MAVATRAPTLSLFALAIAHCGGSSNDDVVGPAGDGGASSSTSSGSSTSTSSSSSTSASSSGSSTGDGSAPTDAATTGDAATVSCSPNVTKCTFPGSACQCCTTASGPLCLCTVTCKNDTQCPDSTLSLCNHAKSGGGSSNGICTARDAPACQ